MYHAHTNEPSAAPLAFDREALRASGWTSFTLMMTVESEFREQLMAVAAQLGTAVATRRGGLSCDVLQPTEKQSAKPRSLSKVHGYGEFPLHTDTGHWLTPC